MRTVCLATLFTLLLNSGFAQTAFPKFWLSTIGSSGCRFYSPVEGMMFNMNISEDGSDVWTAYAETDGFYFEVICVRMAKHIEGNEDMIQMHIETYLDYLQDQYHIVSTRGYRSGHRMETNPMAIGVTDQWIDDRNFGYHVKAWADKRMMAVMMVSSLKTPNPNAVQVFLNGFRFP